MIFREIRFDRGKENNMRTCVCRDCGGIFTNETLFMIHMEMAHGVKVIKLDEQGHEYKSLSNHNFEDTAKELDGVTIKLDTVSASSINVFDIINDTEDDKELTKEQ